MTEPTHQLLSIVIPMWNEEEYLGRAVEAASEAGRSLVRAGEIADFELVIVDDASTDRTGPMADALAAADPHVRVIHHERNRKLGGSLKTGFAHAKGDLVLYTDADLPVDMEQTVRACRLLRHYEADIVSAWRFDRTGEGLVRVVYSTCYNLLVRWLFGVRIRDVNFAFKLIRGSVFDHIALESEGSFIDAELVVRASKLGYKLIQFGVDYFPRTRGVSTLSSPSVILKILREMRHLRQELRGIQPLSEEERLAPRRLAGPAPC